MTPRMKATLRSLAIAIAVGLIIGELMHLLLPLKIGVALLFVAAIWCVWKFFLLLKGKA